MKETENDSKTPICNYKKILNNKCINGAITNEQIKEYYNQIKDEYITRNYDGENKIIKTKNTIYQVSTLEDQKNNTDSDVSSIDLGNCEKILKEKYNISEGESFIIIKTDIKNNDLSSTYVQYEIYHPYTLVKINMDYCLKEKIIINSPVNLHPEILSLYKSLNESGYNFFDSKDPYYNDICSVYTSQSGTDIALFDRQKELTDLNNNVSMCQSGCKLISFNSAVQKSQCNCEIQNNSTEIDFTKISFNRDEIVTSFLVVIEYSNFMVLKCYKKAFDCSSFFRNIGRIIMTIILLLYLILLFIYLIKDKKNIDTFLNSILLYKSNAMKINRNINKAKNEINKNNKIENKSKKSKNNSKNKKIKEKKSQPPKRNLNKKDIKYMKGKDKNKRDYLNKTDNDLSSKKLRKIKINITKIHNLKNNKIKSNNKISPKIDIFGNNKITNNKTKINFNEKNKDIALKNFNTQELNSLSYNLALIYDKRTYLQYYISLLKKKQLILFTFFPSNDYNLMTLKISLFLMSFSLYFTMNGFFFSDETMHRIYVDKGSYNIFYQLPKILYSTVISAIINTILKFLCLSEKNLLAIKQEKNLKIATKKSKKVKNCILIKFIIFFILSTSLLLFFWYFISCFCGVYINTQKILINDTIFSFILSMIYPFGINLIPGIFRISALRAKNKNKECLYNFSGVVALI